MLTKTISAALIIYSLQACSAIGKKNAYNFQIDPSLYKTPFETSYSENDLEFAKNFLAIQRNIFEGFPQKDEVDRLLTQVKKTELFGQTQNDLQKLSEILDSHDFKKLSQNCSRTKKTDSTLSIDDRFNNAIALLCQKKHLSLVNDKFQNLSDGDIKDKTLRILTTFIEEEESTGLKQFLLGAKRKGKKQHQEASKLIEGIVLQSHNVPDKSVLKEMGQSSEFKKFLSAKQSLAKNTKSAKEEFLDLYKEAETDLEEGRTIEGQDKTQRLIALYKKSVPVPAKRAWQSFSNIGRDLYFQGLTTEAIDLFDYALQIAPEEQKSDAYFNLIYPHLVDREYAKAKKLIQKYNLLSQLDKIDIKLKFWIGYTLIRNKDTSRGVDILEEVINKNPMSFYSIISVKEISSLNPKMNNDQLVSKIISNAPMKNFELVDLSPELVNSIKRLNIWKKLSADRNLLLEAKNILRIRKEDAFKNPSLSASTSNETFKEYLVLNVVKYFNSDNKFIYSFKIFQNIADEVQLPVNKTTVALLYPFAYFDKIQENAREIDPLMVISLIRQESAFNPVATSSVGARGLMQLMPTTAKRFNRKVRTNHLYNPDINLAIGTKYFTQLLNMFDGNIIYALASYNAGESRVQRWRKEIFKTNDPLLTIETIPFEETRNYVKLIYRNNFFYSWMANKTNVSRPLEETFKLSVSEDY